VSIQDMLHELYWGLHDGVSEADWEVLYEADRQKMIEGAKRNGRNIADSRHPWRSVKKLDFLGAATEFVGLADHQVFIKDRVSNGSMWQRTWVLLLAEGGQLVGEDPMSTSSRLYE